MKVGMGRRYRDEVTGFEGIASGIFEYLQSCRRVRRTTLPEGESLMTPATCDFCHAASSAVVFRGRFACGSCAYSEWGSTAAWRWLQMERVTKR